MTSAAALALLLAGASGCKKKEYCDRLVRLACDHVENKTGGDARCAELTAQAEHVDDEQCRKTLRLIQEAGRVQAASGE